MKTFVLLIFFVVTFSCKTENSQPVAIAEIQNEIVDNPIIDNEPYKISLGIDKTATDTYSLSINMELNNGAHFVSPNAKRDFSGKFTFSIDDNVAFKQQGNLMEYPLSKEEFDAHPFTDGFVNWVQVNTTYTQQIQVNKHEEFQVMGYIQFTIEPRCTLEKIPIIIKYQDGEMKFEIFQC